MSNHEWDVTNASFRLVKDPKGTSSSSKIVSKSWVIVSGPHPDNFKKICFSFPCYYMFLFRPGTSKSTFKGCYSLRDPLPAKHLEEQTDTKTYDLWCRKGGGTGWQDIKAIDLWCRKGGGTGWQNIKAIDLWCRKGGGTGWQDIKGTDLWCRKGGGKGWQGISASSGARGVAERDEGGWKLLIFGAWQVAEEGIRRASRLLIWGILRCRTGGRKEQQDIKPTAHEM